ncbi:hypothetical protein HanPSC8_Chr09g0352341 [Helianthus annuus]|nr:hypothetical protein HanPSC8_Chr09g0352341 [Helianthus annuus]
MVSFRLVKAYLRPIIAYFTALHGCPATPLQQNIFTKLKALYLCFQKSRNFSWH